MAYDGTEYCGWQLQNNGITVEQVLNEALSETLGEEIRVIGASRTDSGVHARGNIAVFDTRARIPGEKIAFAVNQKLPNDVVVRKSEEVSREFHPRYRATVKTYEYVIYNDRHPDPLVRRYSHFCYQPLDVEKMQKGADYLIGRHDFASFCCARAQVLSTVRTIMDVQVLKEENTITIRIKGDGFLYNMVRMIAGVLMRVGVGFYPPEEVQNILDKRERGYARPTAPAQGLTLVKIEYPEVRCPWAKKAEDIAYHDKEWGVPKHDDRELFEMLILEGQQAGLSWNTILNKREAMRRAFDYFDPVVVAEYTEEKIEAFMQDASLIRNRRKLEALVVNARAFIKVQEEFGSFDAFIWSYAPDGPIVNHWETMEEVPASDALSDRLSKDLKKRGFKFVGTTICYSFLQSIGIINDHLESCFRHGELRDYYEACKIKSNK